MTQELDAFAEMMLDEAAVLAHASISPNDLRRLWAEGVTDVKKLADHFGVTEQEIEWRAVRLGLKKPQPGVDWATARQLWSEGKNIREIANNLNISPGHVANILGRPEEDIGPHMRRMQVMTLAQKGLTHAEIGAKVGLSAGSVNRILTLAGSHGMAAIAARRGQVLEMHNAGMTPDEIAEGTSYNRKYVSAILKDYGLEPHTRPGTRPSEAEALRRWQQVWDMDDEGVSPKEIAERVGLSVANASQHLRQLREAGLVIATRDGKFVRYGLADDAVLELLAVIGRVAERQRAEVTRVVSGYFDQLDAMEPVSRGELEARVRAGLVTVIDV
ncbi:MAG: winged helix-turn-helix transcriptional regulator, partial [Gammaproteobacteria bacterium]|nr:winged helix-turn-helix transcriptional regulator [Gammaproteobacteria bacterium]